MQKFTANANATAGLQIDSLLSLANAAIASAERLAALNLNTSRSLLEDNLNTAKALLGAKDQKELAELQASMAQPAVEKAVAYSRAVYEISTETQGEVSKLVESQVAEVQKGMSDAISKVGSNTPGGSEAAVDAFQRTVAAANAAFETLNQAAKQVSEIAEANMNAAAAASTKAVLAAAKGVKL